MNARFYTELKTIILATFGTSGVDDKPNDLRHESYEHVVGCVTEKGGGISYDERMESGG
ncbi:hypothetical protein JCM19037_1045 [Geomicrobium sp. JCM 19037]|nr:hypothetical protein JCM19037_1045 [Geomicrobium sp. JCM 19037]